MTLQALYDVPAPAKLNLFLHIVGKRADGYHLLQSPFMLIDWADTLHFERRNDGRLLRHDIPTELQTELPAEDLCLRAARTLQAASGITAGADIHIAKHLPTGAGMGGGSSDAASTLLALNRLWDLNWPRARLAELALDLGADVPFFIGGNNAFVQGIGEELTPIELPPARYVVVKPAASLPTAHIFSHPQLVRDTERVILAGYLEQAQILSKSGQPDSDLADLRELTKVGSWKPGHGDFGRNDLQGPAQAVCTEVKQVADWLLQRFGNSRMTGSGSAVFSRLNEKTETDTTTDESSVATSLAELPQEWVGRLCRSLVQHPLKDWAR